MDKAAIEKLLSSLTASDFGWRCDLPHDTAQFLGHPVSIEIHTRHIPEDGPPPGPDAQKLALARQVLGALPNVLEVAEGEFCRYGGGKGADQTQIRHPHIWLSLDEFEEDGPGQWSFVVERQDSPDYGLHVEFDGLEFLECWGGD